MRAAIYVRLSDFRGKDDKTLSPEGQEAMCRAYAESRGWTIVEDAVVHELDFTATAKGMRLDRPELSRLLKRLGDFDVIIARDLSRFSRSVADFITLSEIVGAEGVALVSVKDNLDMSTAQARAMTTVMAAFAALEAEVTAERVAAHRAEAAKIGRYAGGITPFGYRRADDEQILIPDADEAATLARAVELILDAGESLYGAAQTLNAEGRMPRKGTWTTTRLKRTLLNPATRGYIIHKGAPVMQEDGTPLAPYEAVISEDIRARLLDRLDPDGLDAIRRARHVMTPEERKKTAAPKAKTPQRRKRAALLSGVAVCAMCGGNLHRAVVTDYDVYRCGGKSVGRDCKGVTMKSAHLDEYVTGEYLRVWGAEPEREVTVITRDVAGIAEAEEALRAATDEMRVPGADIATLAARVSALHGRLQTLRSLKATETQETLTGRTLAEAFDAADTLDEKRALLSATIARVTVASGVRGRRTFDPGRVAIFWHEVPGDTYPDDAYVDEDAIIR